MDLAPQLERDRQRTATPSEVTRAERLPSAYADPDHVCATDSSRVRGGIDDGAVKVERRRLMVHTSRSRGTDDAPDVGFFRAPPFFTRQHAPWEQTSCLLPNRGLPSFTANDSNVTARDGRLAGRRTCWHSS
jgi:hypothetical protein